MFDPIIERIISYKKVVSSSLQKHYLRFVNIINNINNYISILSKKIRYQFDLKHEYLKLGEYLSNLDKDKYDLSKDKFFVEQMNKIIYKKKLLDKNKEKLSTLYKKDKKNI